MTPRTAIAATLCTALAATCGTAYGVERRFDPLTDVGVTQRIDEPVPLDLVFRDGRGNKVELAGLIDGDLPAIVSMNYSDCPMLCSLQLNGLVAGLKGVKGLTAGRDYRVVSVSFDPNESPSRAAATQDKYNLEYGRGQGGWHFLVADRQGRNVDIERLAEALGIRYGIDPITGEYSHPAAAALVTPGGKISQYLSGVEYDPRTLRLLITEAGQGKIGALGDLFFLTCFHYDADEQAYFPNMAKIMMTVGGGFTVLVLGGGLLAFFVQEKSRADGAVAADKQGLSGAAAGPQVS